VELPD